MDREFSFDREPKRENIAAGTLGALLGSLAGVVCIVLVSRLNIVASVSGLVMAVCALKGYEKLAGSLSKKGAAISCVIILLMTYFAHHLDITIELVQEIGMSFPDAFLSVPKLLRLDIIDKAVFWGNLALLYLFTLMGAVPTICGSLAPPVPQPFQSQPAETRKESPAQAEFFPADRSMTAKPRYYGLGLALFFLVSGILLFAIGIDYVSAVFTGLVLFVSALSVYFVSLQYVPDTMFLFARIDGELWRVNLSQLNGNAGYRFTDSNLTMTGVRWHKLSPAEQERAKTSVQNLVAAVSTVYDEHPDRFENAIALPLLEPALLKQNRWAWRISYLGHNGKRRRLTIHKSYPGLAPAPGCEPSEKPVPFRWRWLFLPLAAALAVGALGVAVDLTNASHDRTHGSGRLEPASSSEPASSAASGAGTVELTMDNYQSMFHLAEEDGYRCLGVGYLPVPPEAFGENVFVNAYVPYCEEPVYSDDGYTLTSTAHGMRVSISVTATEGDARGAVAAAFDAFAASGADLYEDGVYDTEFSEEYGVAVKQVFYFEENGTLPRLCLFYADEPVNGHCFTARITYLLEQTDDEYASVLAELSDAFGLNLQEIEPYSVNS